MLRLLLPLALALGALPATAQAATLLSVPAAGGRPTELARLPGAYFDTPCWRSDGALVGRSERAKAVPAYGTFRAGSKPRWRKTDEYVLGASFAPGCELVAEIHYVFEDDRQGDGGVLVRDRAGKEIMRLQSHTWPDAPSIAWSRDGTRLAVVMNERRATTLRVADVASGRVLARVEAEFTTVSADAFAPDGSAVVYEQSPSQVRVLDVARGRARTLAGDRDGRELRAPAWSPKGDRIAAVNLGGGIELLDPALGYGPTIPTSSVWTETLTWSPDGGTLALQYKRPNDRGSRERYGLALVAPAPDGRLRRLILPTPDLSPPVWSPDGSALAVSRRG